MGTTFQSNTATSFQVGCSKDADCYAASTTPYVVAATTTADKAKRCCMYFGYITAPTGTYD